MKAKLLIALLWICWTFVATDGQPMPENKDIIPDVFVLAESLNDMRENTSTTDVELTETEQKLIKSINKDQSAEQISTEPPLKELSVNNSNETELRTPNSLQPVIKSKEEQATAGSQQPDQKAVSTNPPLATLPQPKQIVIPLHQLPNYAPLQPIYFNSSWYPPQPQFIFNQPPPMLPLMPLPPPMMIPPQFPSPFFIMMQPGSNVQGTPPIQQPNQKPSTNKQPNQLPIFFGQPPSPPHFNPLTFPMAGSPPATPLLPQFMLLNQQISPSDSVIGQSSVFVSQPNQNQEFIIVRTK